jgi:hypothetical protein
VSGFAAIATARWVRTRRTTFAFAVGLSVLGCSAAAPATESNPPMQPIPSPTTSIERPASSSQPSPASVELLTGDTGCYAGGEQGTAGVLVVDPEFGTRFNGMPVMWPAGFTGVPVGSEVEVRDSAGNAVAMTGKPYYISNAYVGWDGETYKLAEEIGAYPAAAACGYAWDFVDCATGAAPYCDVIPPPPSPTPEPIVLDAAQAGPVLCHALTALVAAQHDHAAPLVKLFIDNVPPSDDPVPAWSAEDSAAAKEHGLAMTETVAALGRSLANLESPDLETLMAATKETYRLYDDGMAWLKRYLDALPGGDFTGISDPVATLQDGGIALRTAVDLMAEADAAGTVDCEVPAP